MKGPKVVLIIVLMFISVYPSNVFSFQNEPDGFRGIKWGTDISTLKGMKYIETDPRYGVKLFVREGDQLTIGSAQVDKLIYGFWNSFFCDVNIFAKDFISWIGLKDACFEKFGPGAKWRDCYFWEGNIT